FRVANWGQHTLPLRLPPGSRPLAVQVDGRWLPRLIPAAPASSGGEPEELALPVPSRGETLPAEAVHRYELVYTRAAPPLSPSPGPAWAPLPAPRPPPPRAAGASPRLPPRMAVGPETDAVARGALSARAGRAQRLRAASPAASSRRPVPPTRCRAGTRNSAAG